MNMELIQIIIRAIFAIITAIRVHDSGESTTEKEKTGIGDLANVFGGLFSF
ncbi:MAG: hypothetical protein IJM45_05610 [Clostridia bacterium]|nr:hypothetical protein [Clostridia bacterium]